MRELLGSALLRFGAMAATALLVAQAPAQQIVPPTGYSGGPRGLDVAPPVEPDAPAIRSLPLSAMTARFRIDPNYHRAALAHVRPVGAYAIDEPRGTRLEAAWSAGFLPVTLGSTDGRCFMLFADYTDARLSNALLRHARCSGRRTSDQPAPEPPADSGLRKIGAAWQFGAWANDRDGTTVIGAPVVGRFEPLFEARMATTAIAAMLSPDAPLGNVTLVGRIDQQLVVVVLDVAF